MPQLPDLPPAENLTPETYKLCYCCPAVTTFSEGGLEKRLGSFIVKTLAIRSLIRYAYF